MDEFLKCSLLGWLQSEERPCSTGDFSLQLMTVDGASICIWTLAGCKLKILERQPRNQFLAITESWILWKAAVGRRVAKLQLVVAGGLEVECRVETWDARSWGYHAGRQPLNSLPTTGKTNGSSVVLQDSNRWQVDPASSRITKSDTDTFFRSENSSAYEKVHYFRMVVRWYHLVTSHLLNLLLDTSAQNFARNVNNRGLRSGRLSTRGVTRYYVGVQWDGVCWKSWFIESSSRGTSRPVSSVFSEKCKHLIRRCRVFFAQSVCYCPRAAGATVRTVCVKKRRRVLYCVCV